MSRMDAASWQQMLVRVGKSLISILDTHALQGAGP
jgi:hypothetical protein